MGRWKEQRKGGGGEGGSEEGAKTHENYAQTQKSTTNEHKQFKDSVYLCQTCR